ncbi:MAG: SDR family oxidoreductase [Proteobacteria bacterium]|nr:SDR family oxidoreductase [Pseudomonadota bacterium]
MSKLALVTGAGRGAASTASNKASTEASLETSTDQPLWPEPGRALATAAAGSFVRSQTATRQPSFASLWAMAAPMPRPVTGLVCNAGVLLMAADGERPTIFDMTLDDWEKTHAVNTRGVFLSIRAYARRRRALPVAGGRVTTTSSVAAELGGYRGSASYISSKSAILGFTRAMARELSSLGITVNCVAPGVIDAPMLTAATPRSAAPGSMDALAQAVPLGRLGTPEDIAGAVSFLLSEQASYVTGATIDVNGGYRMA